LIQPGDQVLDIGANCGFLTLWMSKLVGPQGIVHAFEPNPTLYNSLKTTVAHNRISNVHIHSAALGSFNGTMDLLVPKGNLGAASLIRNVRQAANTYAVSVMKLDEAISPKSGSRIKLIKLDVEGFELEVLTGARRILEEFHPSAIVFESNEEAQRGEVTPVMRLLKDFGYDFLVIPRCMVWMRTKIVHLDQPRTIFGHDFIAAPRGECFDRIRDLLRAR